MASAVLEKIKSILQAKSPRVDEGDLEHRFVQMAGEWLTDWINQRSAVSGPNFENWRRYDQAYLGNLPDYEECYDHYHPKVRSNHLQAFADVNISTLANERHRITYRPVEPLDTRFATMCDKLQSSDWRYSCGDRVLRLCYRDIILKGIGYAKTWYDHPRGRTMFGYVNPEHVVVDGDSDPSMLSAIGYATLTKVPLYMLPRMFPKFSWDQIGEVTTEGKMDVINIGDPLPVPERFLRPRGNFGYSRTPETSIELRRKPVVIAEIWIRDAGIVDVFLPKAVRAGLKKNNRKSIVLTIAGDRVMDIALGYPQDRFPLTVFRGTERPGSYYPQGDVERAISVECWKRVITSRIVHKEQLSCNAFWMRNAIDGAGLPEILDPIPGIMYECQGDPAKAVREFRVPAPTQDDLAVREMLIRDLQEIMHTQEQTRGKRPKGVESGRALNVLNEAVRSVLEPRIQSNADSLRMGHAQTWIDLANEHYKGGEGGHVSRMLGKEAGQEWDGLKERAADFDVRVIIGTGIEVDAETQATTIQTLHGMQAFNPEIPAQARLPLLKSMQPFAELDEEIDKLEQQIEDEIKNPPPPPGGPGTATAPGAEAPPQELVGGAV